MLQLLTRKSSLLLTFFISISFTNITQETADKNKGWQKENTEF